MKVHSDAVYNTIPYTINEDDNIICLQSKDKKIVYAYVLSDKTNDVVLPSSIS